MASVEALKSKYGPRGVEFVVVYVQEPHPGEPAYRSFTQPETLEERKRYAERLVAEREMEVSVVVDDMDDRVWRQFGSLPNMVYVIDRDGRIAYHATWTMADRIDSVLADLA